MYLLVARTKKDVCFPIRLQISICVLSLQRYSHLKANLRFPVIQIVKRNSFLQPFISKAAVPILLLRFAMIDRLFSFLNPIIPFWNHSISMRNQWEKKILVFRYYSFEAHSCVDSKHSESIRRTCFCLWWLIREQSHRMMRKWENGYLWIGGNRSRRSSHNWSRFHQTITEGYLHLSNTKSILSRVTVPIFPKLLCPPLNCVNEGRSIHSSAYSISLRIVNVFL